MKKLDRTRNSIRNLIWGVINKGVTLLIPFFLRNVIILVLGREYLGLNSLFTSVLNVLNLAELGIGSAMVYAMYEPMANEDTVGVCRLLFLYRRIYFFIGMTVLLIGLSVMPFLKFIVKDDCQGLNLYALYFIFLADSALSYFLSAYRTSLLTASQRTDISSNIGSVVHILMNAFQVIILLAFKDYYAYILMKPVFTVVNNICIFYVTKRMYPHYRPQGRVKMSVLGDMFGHVRALIGHKIGSTVVMSVDSMVISAFLGLSALAVYSNYYYIIYFIVGIDGIVMNGMLAGIGNSLITESKKANLRLFGDISFVMSWLVSWCSSCLLCMVQPFMKLWMGEGMMLEMPSVLWLVLYFYTWQFRCPVLFFKDAAGMWSADFWKPYVSALVNLFLNILLVRLIGLNGVFISTIFCMTFINFPWEGHVLFRDLFDMDAGRYFAVQLKAFIKAALMCAASYFVCQLFAFDGILDIVVRLFVCILVPNIVFIILSWNEKEFAHLLYRLSGLHKTYQKCGSSDT